MSKVKIVSDTGAKLKKIKEGSVFDSQECFVLELLQNSLRAKANVVNIDFNYKDNIFRFKDNGVGCKNYKNLFTLDSSDWQSTKEGFGIGFWSILAYPIKRAVVSSNNWVANIDMEEILKNNLDVQINYLDCCIKGFEVELYCEEEANFNYLEEYCRKQSSMQEYDVYINGYYVDKRDVIEEYRNNEPRNLYQNNRWFEGIFGIGESSDIDIYYEGRYVCKQYSNGNISGVIKLKKGALTLKEPDRKSIIFDYKYTRFKKKLREIYKAVYKQYIPCMSNEEVNRLDIYITDLLSVKEFSKYLSLDKDNFVEDTIKPSKYDNEIAVELDNNINSIDEDDVTSDDKECLTTIVPIVNKDKVTVSEEIGSNSCQTYREESIIKQLKRIRRKVWVSSDEFSKYSECISLAQYYNFTVLKANNYLYKTLFREERIPHISQINDLYRKRNIITDIKLKNNKERVMLELLEPVRKYYNLPQGTFRIANLSLSIEFTDGVRTVDKSVKRNLKNNIEVAAACGKNFIYFDRKYINQFKFKFSKTNKIGLHEIRFIMFILPTLSHELAHLLYNTTDNTLEHYKYESKINEELLKLYLSN